MKPNTFDRLKSAREKTLRLLEGVSQSASEEKPGKKSINLGEAGSWSLGEIVDHILKVQRSLSKEIEILLQLDAEAQSTVLKRGVKDYDVAPALIPKSLMPYLEPAFRVLNKGVAAILPISVRESILRNRIVPIQNPTRWKPEYGRDLNELRQELKTSLEELEKILEQEPKKPWEELVLSHSIFGSYSVSELLIVLEVHETWHQKDLDSSVRGY